MPEGDHALSLRAFLLREERGLEGALPETRGCLTIVAVR
jgi:hypothetical protein